MKILILGAGAIGGYFGGRLVQAGADVSFLVRARRQAQLHERGLVVRSPHGDFNVPVRALRREDISAPADLLLLACKAYDLEAAIEAIAPAMGERTTLVPLLNGLAHIDRQRDLESGGATEGAHIVGDMLQRVEAVGVDPGALRTAWCHLQVAQRRRLAAAAA